MIDWNGDRAEVVAWVRGVFDGLGLSGRELGVLFGTSENTICRWRSGRAVPRMLKVRERLEKMAKKQGK